MESLTRIFSDENLDAYKTDKSICSVTPHAVVRPRTTNDIEDLVKYVLEHEVGNKHFSLTARAGGTCMSGGPLNEGLIVDMSAHMTDIKEFDQEKNTLLVEGGAWYRDIETALLKKNRMFAPYTSSKDICSIGGMVGNNASGEKSFRYGPTRENIRSLSMVCGDGNTYAFGPLSTKEFGEKMNQNTFEGELYTKLHRLYTKNEELLISEVPDTRKNTAGYALRDIYSKETDTWNLTPLIVGSQGTLGIVTAIELETVPILPHKKLFVLPIDSFENVPDILEAVTTHNPETIEVYDNATLTYACASNAATKKHLSHLLSSRAVLLVQYAEPTRFELEERSKVFIKKCTEQSILFEEPDEEAEKAHWDTRRRSYTLFYENAKHGRPVPIIEDISVHRKDLDTLFDDIDTIMKKYEYEYVFHGHIGDASIRVFPLIDFSKKESKENMMKMAEEVFMLIEKRRGTISTDHGDGIVRTPFLPIMFSPEAMQVFQKVKDAFDPFHIFNPGKKLSVTKEYFLEHIA